ncbi:hypothetical protein X566_07475 [Afipia sp. P52-10]|nr:hypothetical protein X566_07475 [Afipia sp. P52-10]
MIWRASVLLAMDPPDRNLPSFHSFSAHNVYAFAVCKHGPLADAALRKESRDVSRVRECRTSRTNVIVMNE